MLPGRHRQWGDMSAVRSIADHDAQLRERQIARDQLGLAMRNLRPNAFLMPALAAVVCILFHQWLPAPRLAAWFAIVAIGCVPVGAAAIQFGRPAPELTEAQQRRRLLTAAGCYVLFTLSWASMGLFLWVPHNDLACLIVILLLACTVAGNGALIGASVPLTALSFTVYGSALVLTPLQTGGPAYDGLAILAVLYLGYMGYMARQIYLTARDMLALRHEKTDLIEALARSKAESDRAREHAEAASRAKSQFLANMSHELRTPLNAILGFSEMITSRVFAPDSDKHYEYAGLIHDSGFHLLTLINDILDLAKIESGSWTLRERPLDIGAMIEETCAMVQPRALAAGCTVTADVEAGLPLVSADERAMKQILLNLLSNAVKFTPRGGEVVAFAWRADDGGVKLGVTDTGVGIAQDDQERVFQNFGQGRHDIATADKGTGLGLPIVKGLVEAHGGTIHLTSRIGEGTTVSVALPPSRVLPPVALKDAS